MGRFIDFQIQWNEDPEVLGQEIIRHLTVNRLRAKKPTVIFLGGDSGEGKSYTALKIADIVNEYYDVDTAEVLDNFVVYTPLEYTKKLDYLLFNKEAKNIRVLMIDEAREMIKAHLWYSFINQAIADANAMSRRIKPLVVIVVSQFIKDIDPSVRRTLTFYGKCVRPLSGSTIFTLYRIWKDDMDIEHPKMRIRKIRGYIIKNGRYFQFTPDRFRVKLPRKEIIERYEKMNFESKAKIIRQKLELLMKNLEKELGHQFDKVDQLVTYYVEHPELMHLIVERKRNKIKVKKEFKQMHDLTGMEVKEFEKRLLEKLAEKGLAKVVET